MKKVTIIVLTFLATVLFAQEPDSIKVSKSEYNQLQTENQRLKEIVIEKYLAETEKNAQDTFVDLYLHCNDMERYNVVLRTTLQNFADDIVKVKTLAGLDSVLIKHNVKRK